jgi:hypothetical protein
MSDRPNTAAAAAANDSKEEEDDVDSNNKLPPQVNYLILFILNFTDFMPQK